MKAHVVAVEVTDDHLENVSRVTFEAEIRWSETIGLSPVLHHPVVALVRHAQERFAVDMPLTVEIGPFDPASMDDDELGETMRACLEELAKRMVARGADGP